MLGGSGRQPLWAEVAPVSLSLSGLVCVGSGEPNTLALRKPQVKRHAWDFMSSRTGKSHGAPYESRLENWRGECLTSDYLLDPGLGLFLVLWVPMTGSLWSWIHLSKWEQGGHNWLLPAGMEL